MWIRLAVGIALSLVGIVWVGQGVGTVHGSFMTGHAGWAVVGAVALVIGIALVIQGVRANHKPPPSANDPS
jgi:hypothetical protein